MGRTMRRVALIPAYNEEKTIARVAGDARAFVDEVVVVDDGSTDRTRQLAKQAGATVVVHPYNMGLGAAFSTGVNKALEIGADVVVTIDADGQFSTNEIPRILAPIIDGRADFVTGSRFLKESTRPDTPLTNEIGNKLFTKLTNWMTGQKFTDTQCGFRAYSRETLLRLTIFGRFTYTQEVFLDLVNKNMRVVEIPVNVAPRNDGKSRVVKNPVHYGLRALKIMVLAERDHHPLRFFSLISQIFIIPAVSMFALVLGNWILTSHAAPFTSLLSIGGTLLLVGVIFIILALVADMQGRSRKLQEETLYLLKRQRYS
jgi:glycosyltransferase involved in cell wall biosynthesis